MENLSVSDVKTICQEACKNDSDVNQVYDIGMKKINELKLGQDKAKNVTSSVKKDILDIRTVIKTDQKLKPIHLVSEKKTKEINTLQRGSKLYGYECELSEITAEIGNDKDSHRLIYEGSTDRAYGLANRIEIDRNKNSNATIEYVFAPTAIIQEIDTLQSICKLRDAVALLEENNTNQLKKILVLKSKNFMKNLNQVIYPKVMQNLNTKN